MVREGGVSRDERSEKDRKGVEPRLTANEVFTHLSCDGAHHVLRSKVALEETRQLPINVLWCCVALL